MFTFVTGEATTSWDTSQGDNLLNDGVTVVLVVSGIEFVGVLPFTTVESAYKKINI